MNPNKFLENLSQLERNRKNLLAKKEEIEKSIAEIEPELKKAREYIKNLEEHFKNLLRSHNVASLPASLEKFGALPALVYEIYIDCENYKRVKMTGLIAKTYIKTKFTTETGDEQEDPKCKATEKAKKILLDIQSQL